MTYRIVNTDNFGGDYPDEKFVEYAQYNEACALCGVPRDVHKEPSDASSGTPHSTWGDVDTCRAFMRSRRAAYGVLGVPMPMGFVTEHEAQTAADLLNGPYPEHSSRYYKVVEMPYELQPGFEP